MLINWTHFPTFLGAPVSDQDRTAQVVSFCTASPNICQSAVRNIFHVTLLTPDVLRLPEFFEKFINPWSKSSCTLHTNLHCKTNYTKVQTTTAYPHGHTTFLLRQHENTSVTDMTDIPNQLSEQQNMKHNYCCTVASLRCDITLDMVLIFGWPCIVV